MRLVVFGLSITSSWGNGHATLWRSLCRAMVARGWRVTFFERDVPWYAAARDLQEMPGVEVVLYPGWQDAAPRAALALREAEAAIVTSYCPDGVAASAVVLEAPRPVRLYYDLDTPVTLAALAAGRHPSWLPPDLAGFDLVLSYTGGEALERLRLVLGARRAVPLYGSVDPDAHHPVPPQADYAAALSYLGTYAEDRQGALEELFVEPARRLPGQRFVIGGAQYPHGFPWTGNIWFVRHLPPAQHPAFFCSSRLTLNVTRRAMADLGWCPSGRLFEAAACGTPVASDAWPGIGEFYEPGGEILLARSAADICAALALGTEALRRIGLRARERTLAEHTGARRVQELEAALSLVGQAAGR